jgi:hypothetical protein
MSLEKEETIIAGGGPDDYLEARHVVLRGTNREIGRAMADIALTEFDSRPLGASDPTHARATRRYYHEHYPIHEQRILGAADAYGIDEDDDAANFVGLPFLMPPLPGCSVAYVPPKRCEKGSGLVSRNYDFPLEFSAAPSDDRLAGSSSSRGVKMASRPYLFEVYPDEGYPSLYFSQYDLLGGCADGINSEGLTVVMLADDESPARYPAPPVLTVGVGLHPLQATRLLLDTCATVEEAKDALLAAKHYAFMIPAHYIIADRHGNSFVWEWSHLQYSEHIIDGDGETQLITNHLLHQPAPANLSVESDPGWTRTRLSRLTDAFNHAGDGLTPQDLKAVHACTRFTKSLARELTGDPESNPSARTIWHGIYDTEERSLDVSFYLGDNPDGTDRRSPYQSFRLGGDPS